jgi:hypothetical protein
LEEDKMKHIIIFAFLAGTIYAQRLTEPPTFLQVNGTFNGLVEQQSVGHSYSTDPIVNPGQCAWDPDDEMHALFSDGTLQPGEEVSWQWCVIDDTEGHTAHVEGYADTGSSIMVSIEMDDGLGTHLLLTSNQITTARILWHSPKPREVAAAYTVLFTPVYRLDSPKPYYIVGSGIAPNSLYEGKYGGWGVQQTITFRMKNTGAESIKHARFAPSVDIDWWVPRLESWCPGWPDSVQHQYEGDPWYSWCQGDLTTIPN